MTEKRVVIRTGKNKTIGGLWVDSFCNNGAVVIDDDGDVHLVNFRDIRVVADERLQSEDNA